MVPVNVIERVADAVLDRIRILRPEESKTAAVAALAEVERAGYVIVKADLINQCVRDLRSARPMPTIPYVRTADHMTRVADLLEREVRLASRPNRRS